MYGDTVDTLEVYWIDQVTGSQWRLFSKSGDQGETWHRERITFFTNKDYRVCCFSQFSENPFGSLQLKIIKHANAAGRECNPRETTLAPKKNCSPQINNQ